MKKNAWFWGGLAAVCVFCAVYWLAGGNAVYIAHDQYDGDMMNYILHARHLTSATVPEYMGGLDKTFLALGAPLFLPLYALLPPLWAFCAHTTLVALLGYTGMALWCGALTRKPWIACVVGVAFATLPFYTVYGLSVMGQPLLFWLFWRIARRARPVWELVCVTLFAASSSLIFIGFADCALAFCAALAPELAKNDAVRTYFDEWGNRCYLFASELGTNMFYTKDSGITLRDFTPDAAALRALGCTFVLSGVPIDSAARAGLQWEQTFTRADSIYTVYLYRIVQ